MPTFGIDQGDIEWDVPAHAWAAPNYCAAAPVPRNGCRAATSRTPSPTPAYCIYCHYRIGRQRNVYATDDPILCTFFAAYFRASTTGAARAILERDVLRRNHGLRERPPPPLPTRKSAPTKVVDRPYPPFRPGEQEALQRRIAARERNRRPNAFASRVVAQPYITEPYRPWRERKRV
ncbi:hypothetical protein CspHIS471_0605740 [Cutaneotrichosporon sp. HIS471]|nr:hypothetical protein CspHIS471_0605740 [Cutaneotrichosporon sp. HIS471]